MIHDPETIELAAQAIFEFVRNMTMNAILHVDQYDQLKPWNSVEPDDREFYRSMARLFGDVFHNHGDTAKFLHAMVNHWRSKVLDWDCRNESSKAPYKEAASKVEMIFERKTP